MKNIDKIFSKLKESEIEAPDIWNKLEVHLENSPKAYKANVFKTIGLVAGVGVIGLGSYLIIDNINDGDKKEEIVKTEIEVSKTNEKAIEKNNEKTLTFEEAKQIDNQHIKKEDIITTFKVNDESNLVLESSNYSVKPINTSQSYPSEIKIDYIEEDSSKIIEHYLPPISNVPDFKPSNVITPNGDGINDVFVIKNVDKYPDNCLIIFDRNGKSMYKCRGYKNNFNASNIPLGTYFYIFEYNDLGKKVTKSGSITVM